MCMPATDTRNVGEFMVARWRSARREWWIAATEDLDHLGSLVWCGKWAFSPAEDRTYGRDYLPDNGVCDLFRRGHPQTRPSGRADRGSREGDVRLLAFFVFGVVVALVVSEDWHVVLRIEKRMAR